MKLLRRLPFNQNISLIALVALAASGSALVLNGCTENRKNDKKDDASKNIVASPGPTVSPTPSTAPNSNTTTSPQPPANSAGTGSHETKETPAAATVELFSQIKQGMHAGVTYADRTRILTKEAQRCRSNNAALVKQGATYPGIDPNQNPDKIVLNYRNKHHFPNFADACRQDLGLTGSFGHFMKLENLIALENCSRSAELQKQQTPELRSAAREVLLMENLTLLCKLKEENLNPLVQNALSSSFVGTWSDLGK